MHKSFASAAVLGGLLLSGCSTFKEWSVAAQEWYSVQRVKWREMKEKEYKELAAMPPVQMISSSHPEINSCAKLSCALFNDAHRKMKAYIAFSETSHEYTGYVNDVQYYVEVEKLSVQDASEKVRDAVLATDEQHPKGEKIWPKIQKGCAAAKVLGTQDEWERISELNSRRYDLSKSLHKISKRLSDQRDKLKKAKKNHQIGDESYARSIQELDKWDGECEDVVNQVNDAGRCISFMQDQYSRNKELENYAK